MGLYYLQRIHCSADQCLKYVTWNGITDRFGARIKRNLFSTGNYAHEPTEWYGQPRHSCKQLSLCCCLSVWDGGSDWTSAVSQHSVECLFKFYTGGIRSSDDSQWIQLCRPQRPQRNTGIQCKSCGDVDEFCRPAIFAICDPRRKYSSLGQTSCSYVQYNSFNRKPWICDSNPNPQHHVQAVVKIPFVRTR